MSALTVVVDLLSGTQTLTQKIMDMTDQASCMNAIVKTAEP